MYPSTSGSLCPGRAAANTAGAASTPQGDKASTKGALQLHCNTQGHLTPQQTGEFHQPSWVLNSKTPQSSHRNGFTQRGHQITTHKAQLRPQMNWSRPRTAGHTTAGLILRAQQLLPHKAAAPAPAPCRVTGAGRTSLHMANRTQDYQNTKEKKKPSTYPASLPPELSSLAQHSTPTAAASARPCPTALCCPLGASGVPNEPEVPLMSLRCP